MQHTVFKNLNNTISIEKAYEDLAQKGYSLFSIGELTKEEFLKFSYNFGEVIPSGRGKPLVDEILINDGTGTEKLPFHTDKTYWRIPPRYEILYVNDVYHMDFGEITVASLLEAYQSLEEQEKKNLLTYEAKYTNPSNRDQGFNPSARFVNIIDGNIEFFRYRLDIFDSNREEIIKMKDYIETHFVKVAYQKQDILILDNWKYAAGRNITAWGEDGFRHLYRTLVF